MKVSAKPSCLHPSFPSGGLSPFSYSLPFLSSVGRPSTCTRPGRWAALVLRQPFHPKGSLQKRERPVHLVQANHSVWPPGWATSAVSSLPATPRFSRGLPAGLLWLHRSHKDVQAAEISLCTVLLVLTPKLCLSACQSVCPTRLHTPTLMCISDMLGVQQTLVE